ncbi:hypothetical protein COO60DRAFT_1531574 [Scenedesmus sp. NREL 46B-D3]|nr:hypothetical protein COO60DRAFT_1531574 [Scenedesmus sp. NREL 46B-D3]
MYQLSTQPLAGHANCQPVLLGLLLPLPTCAVRPWCWCACTIRETEILFKVTVMFCTTDLARNQNITGSTSPDQPVMPTTCTTSPKTSLHAATRTTKYATQV